MKDDFTEKEIAWLNSHGGRDEVDVFYEPDGKKYVFMTDGHGRDKQVYLPE